jgi:predicted outer membrane protein
MRYTPFLLVLAIAGTALATLYGPQEPPQQHNPSGTARETSKEDATENDILFATWLLIESNNEIALAELADQRAQNTEIKQFALKLAADHRQMCQKLEPFSSTTGLGASGAEKEDTRVGGGTPPAGDDTSATEAGARTRPVSDGLDHLALLQELGDQCLMSARKELEQKQGEEFDRCFLGMAIGGHMKVNDLLTVFQRHASSDLKTILAEGQKTVEMHLAQAKEIAKRTMSTAGTPGKK